MIIDTEGNITICRTAFAVNDGTEAVTILHMDWRIESLNISVLNILREGEQSWARIGHTCFKDRIVEFEHKALGVAVYPRARKLTGATEP